MPYLGKQPTASDSLSIFKYVASSSQTTFSGADANGQTLSYDIGDGSCQVHLNGIRLSDEDITAENGTSVVLAACTAGDIVHIQATKAFIPADVVSASSGGTFASAVTMASPLAVASGGTGAATHTANNVLIGAGTSAVTSVAPSTSGNVLTSTGSAWSSAAAPGLSGVTAAGGNLTITSGNLIVASGSGIDFSATSDVTAMSSELLDDYEEGTHVVTCTGSTSGGFTMAAGTDTVSYVKIGRSVFIRGYVSASSESSCSGVIQLSLPFAIADDAEWGNGAYTHGVVITDHSGTDGIVGWLDPSTSVIMLYVRSASGGMAGCYNTDVDTAWAASIEMHYFT